MFADVIFLSTFPVSIVTLNFRQRRRYIVIDISGDTGVDNGAIFRRRRYIFLSAFLVLTAT
jgi:hypothetical protein